MPGNSVRAFLAWLDVIPGRHWLVLGDTGELAGEIRAEYKPTGVTLADPTKLTYPDGAFDVAVLRGTPSLDLAKDMRRLIFPSGIVGILVVRGSNAEVERVLRVAGLHAVQSATSTSGAVFARGAR